MSGRTVRQMVLYWLDNEWGDPAWLLRTLSIDQDTDLDTHVLVAVPKCPTCEGTGYCHEHAHYGEEDEGIPDCDICDGRGWVLP